MNTRYTKRFNLKARMFSLYSKVLMLKRGKDAYDKDYWGCNSWR